MGTVSCRTSSRFAASRLVKKVTPVMLPPGRFRLLTSPSFDRVTAEREYDRNRCGRGLGGKRGNRGDCADHGYLPAPLAGLAQTQSERGREGGVSRALERLAMMATRPPLFGSLAFSDGGNQINANGEAPEATCPSTVDMRE